MRLDIHRSRLLLCALVALLSACGPQRVTPPLSFDSDEPLSFSVPAVRGGSLSLEKFRGRYVLLHFWASWCIPCTSELSELQRFYGSVSPRDVVVVAIAVQSDWDAVNEVTRSRKVTYPVGLDRAGSLEAAFHVNGVPATFLLDRSGRLVKILDPQDMQLKTMLSGPRQWALPTAIAAYQRLSKQ